MKERDRQTDTERERETQREREREKQRARKHIYSHNIIKEAQICAHVLWSILGPAVWMLILISLWPHPKAVTNACVRQGSQRKKRSKGPDREGQTFGRLGWALQAWGFPVFQPQP